MSNIVRELYELEVDPDEDRVMLEDKISMNLLNRMGSEEKLSKEEEELFQKWTNPETKKMDAWRIREVMIKTGEHGPIDVSTNKNGVQTIMMTFKNVETIKPLEGTFKTKEEVSYDELIGKVEQKEIDMEVKEYKNVTLIGGRNRENQDMGLDNKNRFIAYLDRSGGGNKGNEKKAEFKAIDYKVMWHLEEEYKNRKVLQATGPVTEKNGRKVQKYSIFSNILSVVWTCLIVCIKVMIATHMIMGKLVFADDTSECIVSTNVNETEFRFCEHFRCQYASDYVHNVTFLCDPDEKICGHMTTNTGGTEILDENGWFINFDCSSDSMSKMDCYELCVARNENCTGKINSTPTCSGDGLFQSFYESDVSVDQMTRNGTTNHNCPNSTWAYTYPDCFCEHVYVNRTHRANSCNKVIHNGIMKWVTLGYNLTRVHLPVRSHLDSDDNDIIMTYDVKKLVSIMNGMNDTIECVLAKEEETILTKVEKEKTKIVHLPPTWYVNSGYMQGNCYYKGHMAKTARFYLVAVTSCELHDCFWCWTVFEDFWCLKPWWKAAFIGFMVLIGIILLMVAPFLVFPVVFLFKAITMLIWWLLKRPSWLWSSKFGVWVRTKLMNGYKAIADNSSKVSESAELNSVVVSDEQKRFEMGKDGKIQRKKKENKGQKLMAIFLMFSIAGSFLGADAQSCDVFAVASGEFKNCVNGPNGTELCDTTFSSTFTFNKIGDTACLSIKDSKGSVAAHVNITWDAIETRNNIEYLYSTSDYDLKAASTFRCYGSGACDERNCANTPVNSKDAYGEISLGVYSDWPGQTKCDRVGSGGLFGSGCFLTTEGCNFNRYGLIPKGDVGKVYKIGNIERTYMYVSLSVVLVDGSNQMRKQFKMTQNTIDPFGDNKVDLTWLGSLSKNKNGIGKEMVMTRAGKARLVNAAPKGVATKGLVGDVQGTTDNAFRSKSRDAFIFDNSNFLKTTSGEYVSYSQIYESGIRTAGEDYLPMLISGNRYLLVDSEIIANQSLGNPTVFSFRTKNPVQIYRKKSNVCPVGEVLEVTGCANCKKGGKIRFNAKSRCEAGAVFVSTDIEGVVLGTESVRLTENNQEYVVSFFTGVFKAKGNLILRGLGGAIELPIVMENREITNLPNATYAQTMAENGEGSASDKNKLFPNISGENVVNKPYESLWDKIMYWVVLIGIIIIGIILLYVLFRFVLIPSIWNGIIKMKKPKVLEKTV